MVYFALIQGYNDKHVIVKINRNRVKLTNGSVIQCKKPICHRIHQVHMKLVIETNLQWVNLADVP